MSPSPGIRFGHPLRLPRFLRVSLLGLAVIALVVWTAFPFFWILLTSLKQPLDVIAAPPRT